MNKVYFALPIYNEEVALPSLLESLQAVQVSEFERNIVAVDDGSKDASGKILRQWQSQCPLKIITHSPNRGIPGVWKSILEYLVPILGDDDVMIFMESDQTSDPALVPQMLKKIEGGADIVIGSRHAPGGAYVRFPLIRTLGSSTVNHCLRMVWRLPGVKDYTIFYRAYRGSILKRAFSGGVNFQARKSFAVNGEILFILAKLNPKVEEVPLRYDYGLKSGPSSMKLIGTLIEYMRLTSIYASK